MVSRPAALSICLEGPDLPQTVSLAGMMIRMELALPDDIDPELWFPCGDVAGARDYLYSSVWHTAPRSDGRVLRRQGRVLPSLR